MLYRIKDILYQNNGKGPYMTSKVGKKYDMRRGRVFELDKEKVIPDQPYYIKFDHVSGWIWTTPVVELKEIDENTLHLITANSIYVLEKVNENHLYFLAPQTKDSLE